MKLGPGLFIYHRLLPMSGFQSHKWPCCEPVSVIMTLAVENDIHFSFRLFTFLDFFIIYFFLSQKISSSYKTCNFVASLKELDIFLIFGCRCAMSWCDLDLTLL